MKKKVITTIIILTVLFSGYLFIKETKFKIDNFESIFETSKKLKDYELANSTIKLTSIKNQKDTLYSLNSNKKVLIHFWATWCKPCIKELPELEKFYKKLSDSVKLIVISDEDYTIQKQFLDSLNYNLPFYQIKSKDKFLPIDTYSLPLTITVKNNKISNTHTGTIDWNNYKLD